MLSRNTEWRQGNILTSESSYSLELIEKDAFEKCVVVISHDCDLANEKEEAVEVIVGTKIEITNSNFVAARNVRCLHLCYKGTEDLQSYIELQHSGRTVVSKEAFAELARSADFLLSSEEKRSLKQWLSARYGRPAFPNAFEDRLGQNGKLLEKLTKILKPVDEYLIGIFFDLGEDRAIELSNNTPYFLRIFLVYEAKKGPTARTAMEGCAEKMTALFHEAFGTPDSAKELALEHCEAIADTQFSIADLRKTDQWLRFDYISLRNVPVSPQLACGTVSV